MDFVKDDFFLKSSVFSVDTTDRPGIESRKLIRFKHSLPCVPLGSAMMLPSSSMTMLIETRLAMLDNLGGDNAHFSFFAFADVTSHVYVCKLVEFKVFLDSTFCICLLDPLWNFLCCIKVAYN